MATVAEENLVVGTEYFLDGSREDRGIFVKSDDGGIYFKPVYGESYGLNREGLIGFSQAGFEYEEV